MPVVTLNSTNIRTDTIDGAAPPAGSIRIGSLAGHSHVGAGAGVLFELPQDLREFAINAATLRCYGAEVTDGYNASYAIHVGTTNNNVAFAEEPLPATIILHGGYLHTLFMVYDPPLHPVDAFINGDISLDVTEMLRARRERSLFAGWPMTEARIYFVREVENQTGVNTFWTELSDFELELDYSLPPPLQLTLPEVIHVGRTRQASVQRAIADGSPLVVDLTASPSGRLILPASVTIPSHQDHVSFEIQGQAEGLVTVTATAGVDEDESDIEVLPAPTPGLGDELGWWCPSRDSAGDGTGTLTDLSGNGNHGTITGSVSWDTNGGARCLSLSGGYVNIGHHAIFDFERTDPFTLSAWLLVPAGSSAGIPVISKLMGSNPNRGYEIRLNNPSASVVHILNTYLSNDLTRQVSHAVFDPRGAWRHWAVTYNGSSTGGGINVYWNGVLRTATTPTSTLSATIRNTVPLQLGGRQGSGSTFRIDDARIYGRALTAGEIAILATSRGVLGDGTITRLAGPLRGRINTHRLNTGRISR